MFHSVHTLAQIQCTIFQGQTLQVYVVGKMILAIRTLYKQMKQAIQVSRMSYRNYHSSDSVLARGSM